MSFIKPLILFENERFFILNKPAGLHSTQLESSANPSLAEYLIKEFPELEAVGARPGEAGLVHRLDFSTGGCLLVAKNQQTWEELRALTQSGKIRKSYLALVEGVFPEKKAVENFLGSPYRRSKKVKVSETPQKRFLLARTSFQCVEVNKEKNISLISAEASPARRHQIRAHAAHLGFPLTGDELYGSTQSLQHLFQAIPPETQFALHAFTLSFKHMRESITVEANPPAFFKSFF